MTKPTILTLDDDTSVLRAIERDLRKEYGLEYRVARADSGGAALELLQELQHRGDASALFLVDQRMPGMTGVEFLEKAMDYYPDARRVLLTAYADTDAAIKAINDIHIDYYMLKPWDPPSEKLYPVLNDLLGDWQTSYRAPFRGIRVVGYQWDPESHRIKDFLARNQIPYQCLDPETGEEAQSLINRSDGSTAELPLVLFEDGVSLEKPANRAIAERVGLKTSADEPFYDLVVVGGGPAGLAASVYGASEGLRTLVVEQHAPGGQAGTSSLIENYLGFPGGLSGGELARRAVTQARRFGVEMLSTQKVVGLSAKGPTRSIALDDGSNLRCRALVVATGVDYRKLEARGIDELTGAGVYYGAAMTEGQSVKDKDVYVVGGANSAGQAAMYFARFARSVTMLVRGESLSLKMSQYLVNQIEATENIRVWTQTRVAEVIGDDRLQQLVIACGEDGSLETVDASALFIFIGAVPHTEWLGDQIARDDHGFILSGADTSLKPDAALPSQADREPYMLETSVPGVFVAGDVRHGSVKRVASAVGEGSMAVMYVHRYLSSV